MLFNISIPPLIGWIMFLGSGIILLKYPDKIRQYDRRMTRYIENEEDYVLFCRVLGFIFIVFSLVPLLFALFPEYGLPQIGK